MGFFSNAGKATAQKIQKNIVIFGANHFPDIMNEAQLQTFADAVTSAGMDLAKLKLRLKEDASALQNAQTSFDDMANAARTLLAQKQTATPEQIAAIEEGITEAKNELTNRKSVLEDAKRRLEETQCDVTAKEADLKKAADFLQTARKKLLDAANTKKRLEDEVARQEARQKENRKGVGIGSFDSSSAVLDAMTDQNNKLREKADGLKAANEALESSSSTTHSSALEAALSANKTTKSDEDALKDLLGE